MRCAFCEGGEMEVSFASSTRETKQDATFLEKGTLCLVLSRGTRENLLRKESCDWVVVCSNPEVSHFAQKVEPVAFRFERSPFNV